jgi:hypothetical protein
MGAQQRDATGPEPPRRDKRAYFALMGTCLALIIGAWVVVWHFSVLAAVIMSAVAMVIPPFAAIVANRASAVDRRRLPALPADPWSLADGGQEGLGGARCGDRAVGG